VPQPRQSSAYAGTIQQDKELQAIFERTYGPVKRQAFIPPKEPRRPTAETAARTVREQISGPEYLLVDGYNIIFAWDELKTIARDNLDAARKALCDLLCNYQGYRKCEVIAVFDAYKVKGGLGSVEKYHNIHVVYTKEAETADAYIERATYEIGKEHRVRVATSDGPEQLIILGHGALRVSASSFHEEMTRVRGQITGVLDRNNQKTKNGAVRAAMEKALDNAQEE
jgi:predicted RNA-binding protein with PIN domain